MDELQMERQQMQTELSRLADVCRNESVPDAFQTFVAGIPTLTKTERRIFDGYAAGLRSREIVEQLDIKDSTLRFHNKNIYEKLGGQLPQAAAAVRGDPELRQRQRPGLRPGRKVTQQAIFSSIRVRVNCKRPLYRRALLRHSDLFVFGCGLSHPSIAAH